MREAAERRVAQLHSKIQGLESRLHQLTAENRALSAAARAPGTGPSTQVDTAPPSHPHPKAACSSMCYKPKQCQVESTVGPTIVRQYDSDTSGSSNAQQEQSCIRDSPSSLAQRQSSSHRIATHDQQRARKQSLQTSVCKQAWHRSHCGSASAVQVQGVECWGCFEGVCRCGMQAQTERVAALETELRRSKRREEKLTALQFRLREDLKQCGGDPG